MLKSKSCLTPGFFTVFFAALSMAWSVSGHAEPKTDNVLAIYKQAVASPIRTDDDKIGGCQAQTSGIPPVHRRAPRHAGAGCRGRSRIHHTAAGAGRWTRRDGVGAGAQLNEALLKRLTAKSQPNISPEVLPFYDPVPSDASRLDLVTIIMNYHDIAYMPVDREQYGQAFVRCAQAGRASRCAGSFGQRGQRRI